MYGRRWAKARKIFLASHPLCTMCKQMGQITVATVVDHIQPHRGNQKLFWDTSNWQPLCKHCHDAHKHSLEMTGKLRGNDTSGNPLDPNHHWNG